jgi:NitT/TauT family transport system ATP-binding protein
MPWRKVRENISLPLELQGEDRRSIDEKVASLVRLVKLEGFENWLPRDLSGGMAQRVAIARALAHDPEVLLLDEPFGQLDALTREQLGEELLRIWQAKKKTVVMVTHAIDEAIFLADRVIVLSPQPGQVRLDLAIDFERPRELAVRYTKKFGKLAEEIRGAIEQLPSISAR